MPESDTFHIDVAHDDLGATVAIAGELDLHTVPDLRMVLLGLADDPWTFSITVDVRALSFIDSTGLGLLITAARTLRDRGGLLRIVNPTTAARRAFEISGLDRTVEVRTNATAG